MYVKHTALTSCFVDDLNVELSGSGDFVQDFASPAQADESSVRSRVNSQLMV